MNTETVWTFLSTQGVDFGLKLLGSLAAWVLGRWLIALARRLVGAALKRGGKVDQTLASYLSSILSVSLNVMLILAILDIFGVKTTSFAALLAGAGLAIGTAWGGLLTHFAAGVFMQVLRPYKVGDYVTIGGTTGTVKELGLFGTTLITADNVVTIVGNNTVFAGSIQNFSALPCRRVDCVAKVANGVDVLDAIARLKSTLATVPNQSPGTSPDVEILQFTPEGPLLCVRPYTHTSNYWQVYFDTHRAVASAFGAAAYPVPETPLAFRKL